MHFPVKEGTLYPLLKRMTDDGHLKAEWEVKQVKGSPLVNIMFSLTRGA